MPGGHTRERAMHGPDVLGDPLGPDSEHSGHGHHRGQGIRSPQHPHRHGRHEAGNSGEDRDEVENSNDFHNLLSNYRFAVLCSPTGRPNREPPRVTSLKPIRPQSFRPESPTKQAFGHLSSAKGNDTLIHPMFQPPKRPTPGRNITWRNRRRAFRDAGSTSGSARKSGRDCCRTRSSQRPHRARGGGTPNTCRSTSTGWSPPSRWRC